MRGHASYPIGWAGAHDSRRYVSVMPDMRWQPLIRGLVYPIQFDQDPVEGIDRVLEMVVRRRAMNATPEDYAEAVDKALQSDEQLALLIPQPHSEAVIRAFLTALRSAAAGSGARAVRRSAAPCRRPPHSLPASRSSRACERPSRGRGRYPRPGPGRTESDRPGRG